MTRRLPTRIAFPLLLGVMLAAAAPAGWAQDEAEDTADAPVETAAVEGRPPLDAFSVVWERNVFNPNRQPATPEAPVASYDAPPPPADSLRLVGVLMVGDDRVAFFEGTRSEFNAHRKAGDALGELLVETVRLDGVELRIGEAQLELAVGRAVVAEDSGEWRIAAPDAPLPAAFAGALGPVAANDGEDATGAPEQTATPASDAAGDPPSAASLLEQLKARRQQELGQP